MKRVYLDQCHWIRLEAAASGKSTDRSIAQALDLLRYGVDQGLVSLPLSAVHYIETYQRPTSRQRLAALMAQLSRFHAIACPSDVLPAELDAYCMIATASRSSRRHSVSSGAVSHSRSARTSLPFRQVMMCPGRPASAPGFEQAADEAIEFLALSGPPDGVPIPGWNENKEYCEFGERHVAHDQALRQALVQDGPATPKAGNSPSPVRSRSAGSSTTSCDVS